MIAKSMFPALISGSCETTQNIEGPPKQRAKSGKAIRIDFSIGIDQRNKTVNHVNQRWEMNVRLCADRKGMRRLQCQEPHPITSTALSEWGRPDETVHRARNIVFHLNLLQLRDQSDEPASPESARRADTANNLTGDSWNEREPGRGSMDLAVASRQVTLDRTNGVQKAIVAIAPTNETHLSQKGWMEELHQSFCDRRGSQSSGNISDGRN
jgi:hypothetical protein